MSCRYEMFIQPLVVYLPSGACRYSTRILLQSNQQTAARGVTYLVVFPSFVISLVINLGGASTVSYLK